jgi:hypothetical protein
MLIEGTVVRITDGGFRGHRGLVVGLPENEPTIAIVMVERPSGPARPAWDVQPVPSLSSHFIRRSDLTPYREC